MCSDMLVELALCVSIVVLLFFKQKAAYEMRISDWSSDVCSSDLSGNGVRRAPLLQGAFLRNAPFQIFETVVTLVALTMRLSPLERDFVAASLLNLLYRF